MDNKLLKNLFLLLFLNTFTFAAVANTASPSSLPDDEQPVHISADALDIQDQTGTSLYTGNVEITQGSLTLNGERIIIKHPGGIIQSLDAFGQQARFKRFDPEEQSWVYGRADQILYNAQQKTLLLIGNAQVKQADKHLITGPKLNYDIQNKTLKAQSTANQSERISVTLMPADKPIDPEKAAHKEPTPQPKELTNQPEQPEQPTEDSENNSLSQENM